MYSEISKLVMPICAVSIALCACSAQSSKNVELVQEAIRNQLKDPTSAQFSNIVELEDSGVVCGEVNAKNSFGGYSGKERFWGSVMDDGQVTALIIEDGGKTFCDMYENAASKVDRERASK